MKTMVNEQNKHSWCVNAFHGMSANNDGSTKMCCMIKKNYNSLDIGETPIYFIGENNISKNFNNPIAEKIRNNLQNGIRDEACSLCWEEEDGGRKSKRMRDNERYIHELTYKGLEKYEGLAKLELNLGNNCNIKCRTCHPSISSTWMKEDFDINHSKTITFKDYAARMKKYHKCYDEESSFWVDLESNLKTIRQFDFYGGEPFLSKKMWEILQICVKENYAKNIELHYNTNGTIWPKETDLWKNFKTINLSFSIDGIGERFEYMRFPAKWEVVKSNMLKARNYSDINGNINISWCITLSSLNIYYLPETIEEYLKNFRDFGIYLNLVHNPTHFNINTLPINVKEKIKSKLEKIPEEFNNINSQVSGIIGFMMNGTYDSEIWNSFKNYVKIHDNYREQDFFKTFEEYARITE